MILGYRKNAQRNWKWLVDGWKKDRILSDAYTAKRRAERRAAA